MKKLIFSFAILALTMVACQNNSEEAIPNQEAAVDMSDFYVYTSSDDVSAKSSADAKNDKCASMKVLNQQLKDNPGLENRMFAIEKHTREYIAAKGSTQKGKPGGGDPTPPNGYVGTVNIPVYVHVIYSNSAQNISDSQINSQITVLNNDFNDTNYNDVPAEFRAVGADIDINFTLSASNIARHSNSTTSWGTNNSVKSAYPPVAGYLNFWVCNIGGGILGYAQFPGGSTSTDGVVVGSAYFGVTGGTYGLGRTATHEVGHWLNLRHIWGDGRCQQDDFVTDTPSSDGPNYGCPSYPTVNCKSTDMTMNYMDYTDDACMNMFTLGQNDRIRAIFASGGSRESFVQ